MFKQVGMLVTAIVCLTGLQSTAMAQSYPNKQVRVIIPFPPGGTLDTVGRLLAQKLSEQTGQAFVVENRAGGNGMIGGDAVAKAPADGYTLLFSASTFVTSPLTMKQPPYDVNRDFTAIALVAQAPLAIAINKDLAVNDVKELLAYGKANPGKLAFAIGSTASAGHLSTELLKKAGQADFLIVPYKGSAPAYQDLLGGRIQGFIDPILGSQAYQKAGQLKVIGVTSKNRVPTLPNVAAVSEAIPGYEFYSWYGLWGPAKLPADVAQKLNAETNKALATDMRERLTSQGLLIAPGSMDDFLRFQRNDISVATKIIADSGIKVE